MSYLDKTGLTHFFEKLKGIFARKETEVPLILSTQTTNTGNWTGVAPFAELKEGQTIRYHLLRTPSGNASLQLTLSGGGTTANLPIYFNKFNRLNTHFSAGSIITLTYGVDVQADQAGTKYTGWFVNDYRDSDTVTRGMWDTNAAKVGSGNKVFGYSLFMEKADGTFESIALSGGTSTGKTKNSAGFRPGRIWYNESSTDRASGAVLPYGAFYRQLDFRYSSNCAQTLTAQAPVYIVGTISNGLFYLDSTWYTQTLPTSNDGKVYMYLGGAYGTYLVAMHPDHPMYVYKEGRIQEWHDSPTYSALRGGTAILNGTDLNEIRTPGNYYCSSTQTAQSLLNNPCQTWFYMRVSLNDGNSTNWPCQEITNGSSGKRYYRYQKGSVTAGWTDWIEYAPNTDTKYSAGAGLALSGTTFSNSGVRAVAEGTTNGTVSVNTNGTSANVPVHGLGALAYKASLGKSDVGLGNVDNTADADKEVKNATALKTARNLSGIAFDGSKSIHRFGLCSTAANVAAKTVTLEDDMPFTLEKGAVVFVKMTNANGIANPTLNVNGTGAKAIKRYATTAPGTNADQSWVAGSVRGFVYDGSYWMVLDWGRTNNDNTIPQAYCSTAAGTAAKAASMTGYALLAKSFVMVTLTASNTAAGPLTLNINSKGAKPIYINGAASSATHNGLPAGSYLVYYDGTNYYFRTDGKIAAEGFSGSGADLTDLNASELSSGTVPTARLPVATEDVNGIINASYIRKMNELWTVHEAATVNNSVVSGSFATNINVSTAWQQDSYTNYWCTKISIPTIKRGAEVVVKYEDCQFLYLLDPPTDGWLEAMDGELWVYAKTQPTFSEAVDHVRISGYFINHTAVDSGIYDPPFKMEKIWENANPTATFPPQMLDLNLRAYDMALVETQALPSNDAMGITYETGFIAKGVASAIMGVAKTSNRTGLRKFTMTNTGIEVGDGIYNGGTHNDYFVPSRIYGIRGFGVFNVEPVWETLLEEGEENNALFPNKFGVSDQLNGYPVLNYGWGTYDGNTGWMIHTRPQSDSWAYLYSKDKIDVTDYSYIIIDCYFYCYGGAAYVGLTQRDEVSGHGFAPSGDPTNIMTVYAHPVDTRTKYRGEVRLNVKELTGEHRLVIACAGSGNSNYEGHSMIISAKAR